MPAGSGPDRECRGSVARCPRDDGGLRFHVPENGRESGEDQEGCDQAGRHSSATLLSGIRTLPGRQRRSWLAGGFHVYCAGWTELCRREIEGTAGSVWALGL